MTQISFFWNNQVLGPCLHSTPCPMYTYLSIPNKDTPLPPFLFPFFNQKTPKPKVTIVNTHESFCPFNFVHYYVITISLISSSFDLDGIIERLPLPETDGLPAILDVSVLCNCNSKSPSPLLLCCRLTSSE